MTKGVILAKREPHFSKGTVDESLVTALVHGLRDTGVVVSLLEPDAEPYYVTKPVDVICNMRRDPVAIRTLAEAFGTSVRFINRPEATLGCLKKSMLLRLSQEHIPAPRYAIFSRPSFDSIDMWPVWLHSTVYNINTPWIGIVNNRKELDSKWREVQHRGDSEIIVCEALTGDLYKVYCVGNEVLDAPNNTVKSLVRKVGRVLGLEVFGVDVVVDQYGSPAVVDVNDWPSFAPVRQTATDLLIKLILETLS